MSKHRYNLFKNSHLIKVSLELNNVIILYAFGLSLKYTADIFNDYK